MRIVPRVSKTHLLVMPLVIFILACVLAWFFKDSLYLFAFVIYLFLRKLYFPLIYPPREVHKILVVGRQHNVLVKPNHEVMICTGLDEALTGYHSFGPEVVFVSLVFALTKTKSKIVALFRNLGDADVYFYEPEQFLGCFDYPTPKI